MKTAYPLFPRIEAQNSSLNPLFLISLIQQLCQFFPTLLIDWSSSLPAVFNSELYHLFFLDYLHKVLHWSSSSAFPLHPIFPIPEPREAESYRGGLPFYFGLHLCSPKYFRTKGSSAMPSPGPSPGTFKGLKSVLSSCRVLVSWPNAHSLKKEKWFFFSFFLYFNIDLFILFVLVVSLVSACKLLVVVCGI